MTNARFSTVAAADIELVLDLHVGHIRALRIDHGGRLVEPLHTAPWVDEQMSATDATIDPGIRALSGDFFCAPFAASDVDPAPAHGWSANSPWREVRIRRDGDAVTALYELERPVSGARVTKELTLRDGHPFVYERHVLAGGQGRLPVASHAMTRFGAAGGHLSFSPKRWGETPAAALETDPGMGMSALVYPARFDDLRAVPIADGGRADLTHYPIAADHEDFAMLVESEDVSFGWAAALQADTGNLFLSLKNPAEFPVTMLWYSNGGRYYPPWNGRHTGVLGIEEGRSFLAYGHRASVMDNPLTRAGIPTAIELDPGGAVALRNIIGGMTTSPEWRSITAVSPDTGKLRITGDTGAIDVPFDSDFLKGSPSWQR